MKKAKQVLLDGPLLSTDELRKRFDEIHKLEARVEAIQAKIDALIMPCNDRRKANKDGNNDPLPKNN